MKAIFSFLKAIILSVVMLCPVLLPSTAHADLPAGVRAVDHAATGTPIDGLTWATAFRTLQDALEFVTAHQGQVSQVWVARGTYNPLEGLDNPPLNPRSATFRLINGVKLYGGFIGVAFGGGGESSLSQRDPERNPTILTGNIGNPGSALDNSFRVVTASLVNSTAVINGFTITESQAGTGLMITRASPNVVRCVFIANREAVSGAGVQIAVGAVVSNPLLVNCSLIDNDAVATGGAMSIGLNCGATLVNCVFSGNKAGQVGGGIYGTPSLPLNMINCTFTGNRAFSSGGAISIAPQGALTSLVNCILWGNTVTNPGASPELAQISVLNNPELVSVTFTCIQGLSFFDMPGSFNIGSDPLFCNPAGYDGLVGTLDDNLRLTASSLCIDAGTEAPPQLMADAADVDDDGNTTELLPWDLDKMTRIVDAIVGSAHNVDMGAYEIPTRCVGDLDHNGTVDSLDLGILLGSWSIPGTVPGCGGVLPCPADLDCNAVVNSLDLGILLSHFGTCPDSGAPAQGGGGGLSAPSIAAPAGAGIPQPVVEVPPLDPDLVMWLMTADIEDLWAWYFEQTEGIASIDQ